MTKRYTDEDVRRLVESVDYTLSIIKGYDLAQTHRELSAALAPFLTDPDEALVEKMAQAIADTGWVDEDASPHAETQVARAALAVVKREGLPS